MHFATRAWIDSASKAFDPTSIPGCVFWVRADLGITLNGTKVSAWADQSGKANNARNATAAQQPLYLASWTNGRPGLQMTGDPTNPQCLFLTTGLSATTYTVGYVGAYTGVVNDYVVPLNTNEEIVLNSAVGNSHLTAYLANGVNASTLTLTSTPGQVFHVVRAFNDLDIVLNGTKQNITTGTAFRSSGGNAIGYGGGGTSTQGTQILGELYYYNRALSSAEQAMLRGYHTGFWKTP